MLLKRSIWHLKGIGIYAWVPVVVLYLITPFLIYVQYKIGERIGDGHGALYSGIIKQCQHLYPLFSVWCMIFVMHEYIEGEGNELLYIQNKIKFIEVGILYVYYMLLMLPAFFIYCYLFHEMIWLYLKLAVICFFYMAFTYFLTYLTKSTVITFMAALIYTMIALFANYMKLSGLSYYSTILYTGSKLLQELLPFFIWSILFFAAGLYCNHFLMKWNS